MAERPPPRPTPVASFVSVARVVAAAINLTAALLVVIPALALAISATVAALLRHRYGAAIIGYVGGGAAAFLFVVLFAFRPVFRRLRRSSPSERARELNLNAALLALIPVVLLAASVTLAASLKQGYVAAIIGSLGVGMTSSLVIAVVGLRPVFRRLVRGCRWDHAEFVYRIDPLNPGHHTQVVLINVTAISPWYRVFENRYHWSAIGQERPPRLISGGSALLGPVNVGEWRYYYIHLGQALRVGETRRIHVEHDLYKVREQPGWHLSKTIIEPIDHLTLRVLLPPDRFPSRIQAFEWHLSRTAKARPLELAVNSVIGEARLEVPRPRHGRRYTIQWGEEVEEAEW